MIFTVETGTCERCLKPLEIGEHAFCPHGFPIADGIQVRGDAIDETIENLAPTPIHFTSRSEKRAWLAAHGIRQKVQHIGTQGSDKNPHTQRWV